MSDKPPLDPLEVIDESLPASPEDATLRALSTLKVTQLKNRLSDAELLQKTIRWCRITVKELLIDVEEAGLGKCANKWDYIEALIRAEYRPREPVPEPAAELNLDDADNGESVLTGLDIEQSSQSHPDISVVNLLVCTIYSDVSSYAKQEIMELMLPASTLSAYEKKLGLINLLEEVPDFRASNQLRVSLQLPRSPAEEVSYHICSNFGHVFIPATGALKIAGFPQSVHQFVLNKPPASRLEPFEKHMARDNNVSTVLFHGTSLTYLHSMLRQGFLPCPDTRFGSGIFMAEEPGLSYWFAQKAPTRFPNIFHGTLHGMLLGCEASGNGRPVQGDGAGVHVITKLDSVIIRYLFLLPEFEMRKYMQPSAVQRVDVERDMIHAFKKIRAGQIGGKSK